MSDPSNPKQGTKPRTSSKPTAVTLPPDATILVEARIKAGETKLQISAVSNLILHDPVLTLDILQVANSIQYGGASVTEVEAALTRLGTVRILEVLADLNVKSQFKEEELLEVMEVLRYNCRRISIVALIVATAIRPTLSKAARMAGLFADVGHMVALTRHGKKYCELAKANRRKALGFRLQKDLNCDVNAELVHHLTIKGVPRLLILAYDLEADAKEGSEADLRFVIQSALELIDAYDNRKFDAYHPDKGLPGHSMLRMLKTNLVQHERLYKACSEYLKMSSAEEAPEAASMLVAEEAEPAEPSPEPTTISVPVYSNNSVRAKSRDALQDFFSLCEQEQDRESLKLKAAEYLHARGLFARTALVRINPKSDEGVIVTAFGLGQKAGDKISVKDPFSPFRAYRVAIKSTNVNAEKTTAPFGSTAYAIGPVDILPSGETVVLYADLSDKQILSLESRRVFRLSLGLLTQSIKTLYAKATAAQAKA